MSEMMIGVISGLVATFLALVISQLWNKIIVPWFEERIYKDAHIEGKWNAKFYFRGNKTEDFIFNIRRTSHHITGDMIGLEDGKKYEIDGEFRNMILTLSYSSKIEYEVDRGCLTLLLIKNGKEFDGHIAYYFSRGYKTKTAPVILIRANPWADTNPVE